MGFLVRLITGTAAALALSAQFALAEVKIGIAAEPYPPFAEKGAGGDWKGWEVEIIGAVCAAMNEECEIVEVAWDGIIPALLAKKIDVIIASMSITEERMKQIDFTAKYYQTPAKFAAPADAGLVDTPEGMAGKTVGVQRGTIHQDFMEGEFPEVDLKLYGTQDEAYLDLEIGRIDAVMADSVAMNDGFLKTEAGAGFAFFGKDYSIPKYHGDGAGIGVRKSDGELKAALSAAIDAIRADGTYGTINAEYFDFNVYGE